MGVVKIKGETREQAMNDLLYKLTRGFTYQDYIQYRKDRDWVKFDALSPLDKLYAIAKEIKEYKNEGY